MRRRSPDVPAEVGRAGEHAPARVDERGAALLEAAIALGLVALIAATGLSAFSGAARVGADTSRKLAALAAAEAALERGSAPAFLAMALDEGAAVLEAAGWRVDGAPYDGDDGEGPLGLVILTAVAGPDPDAPLVTLETLRSLPR